MISCYLNGFILIYLSLIVVDSVPPLIKLESIPVTNLSTDQSW